LPWSSAASVAPAGDAADRLGRQVGIGDRRLDLGHPLRHLREFEAEHGGPLRRRPLAGGEADATAGDHVEPRP
jgi:hypothetical protein